MSEDLWENGQLALIMVLGIIVGAAGGATIGWDSAPPIFCAVSVLALHALSSWSEFGRLVVMEIIEVLLQVRRSDPPPSRARWHRPLSAWAYLRSC